VAGSATGGGAAAGSETGAGIAGGASFVGIGVCAKRLAAVNKIETAMKSQSERSAEIT
jgi:hypothetical protein